MLKIQQIALFWKYLAMSNIFSKLIFLRDFRIYNMEYLHVRKNFKKVPDGGNSISSGEILEINMISAIKFNPIKFPREHFNSQFGPEYCKSDRVWTRKPQITCGE